MFLSLHFINQAGYEVSVGLTEIAAVRYPGTDPTITNEHYIMNNGVVHEAAPGTLQTAIDELLLSNPNAVLELGLDGLTTGQYFTEHVADMDPDIASDLMNAFIVANHPMTVMQTEWFSTGTGVNTLFHGYLTYYK